MKIKQVRNIEVNLVPFGCCIIHWKEGGTSESVIGGLSDGKRYFACANWTGGSKHEIAGLLEDYEDEISQIEYLL